MQNAQQDLFASAILDCYQQYGAIENKTLYALVAKKTGSAFNPAERAGIGRSGEKHNLFARKVRWYQQTLKAAGVIKATARGVWDCVTTKKDISTVNEGETLVAFSTKLGVALLSSAEDAFAKWDTPISLILTSPPYPLAAERKYGNPKQSEYIDWLCGVLEPIIKNLKDGGSMALNISNDIFCPKSPARSTYCERLVIALEDNFGLHLMDRLIWNNTARPPGPIQYASLRRVQLNATYEPIYWFTNNPDKVESNNQRVLQPHTPQHLKLIQAGGVAKASVHCDGAHKKYPGSYGNPTAGKIPRNILEFAHTCVDQQAYKRYARENGLPAHGAPMPLKLAKFIIEFLTERGQLVVDPFAGSLTTGKAAEETDRKWVCVERVLQYLMGSCSRFFTADGYESALVS